MDEFVVIAIKWMDRSQTQWVKSSFCFAHPRCYWLRKCDVTHAQVKCPKCQSQGRFTNSP